MRIKQFALAAAAAACLYTTGCATKVYGPPPPPPPYAGAPLVVQEAEQRGMRAGFDDGARDAASGRGYHPRADRKYATTPGYEPGFGPFPAYRDYFRNAYLRGYYNGFNHR